MEATNNESLVSLLIAKELEIKQMLLYIRQLEDSYNDLTERFNELNKKFYAKKKHNVVGYKMNGNEKERSNS